MKIAAAAEHPSSGVAFVLGERLGRVDVSELRSRIGFPRLVLFLDRDQAGREGARKAADRLRSHNFEVRVFDWDLNMSWNGHSPGPPHHSIADPAEMSVAQLCSLRRRGLI